MREALNSHSDYKVIMDQLYGELTTATKAKFINPRGGILISSPAAKVPYHCDATETMLWHIRGEKTFMFTPIIKTIYGMKNMKIRSQIM